jgi:hypothetical protein
MLPQHAIIFVSMVSMAMFLSAAAFSNGSLKQGMKGGVIMNLYSDLFLDQLEGMFGCTCIDEEATVDEVIILCSPIVRGVLYSEEPNCFADKWFRYSAKSILVCGAAWAAIHMSNLVDKVRENVPSVPVSQLPSAPSRAPCAALLIPPHHPNPSSPS